MMCQCVVRSYLLYNSMIFFTRGYFRIYKNAARYTNCSIHRHREGEDFRGKRGLG